MLVSVVCPFWNEERILESSLDTLGSYMEKLQCAWELVLVDDGSTDDSGGIAGQFCGRNPRARLVRYSPHRGRGEALRRGLEAARGRFIVTTEIDLSWGREIVVEIREAFKRLLKVGVVVASPHLPPGGYRNVPLSRMLVSKVGNWIIRTMLSFPVTMYTGMTRGYRNEVRRLLHSTRDGKEFHLKVLLALLAQGVVILEIPAVIEWSESRMEAFRKSGRIIDLVPLMRRHLALTLRAGLKVLFRK